MIHTLVAQRSNIQEVIKSTINDIIKINKNPTEPISNTSLEEYLQQVKDALLAHPPKHYLNAETISYNPFKTHVYPRLIKYWAAVIDSISVEDIKDLYTSYASQKTELQESSLDITVTNISRKIDLLNRTLIGIGNVNEGTIKDNYSKYDLVASFREGPNPITQKILQSRLDDICSSNGIDPTSISQVSTDPLAAIQSIYSDPQVNNYYTMLDYLEYLFSSVENATSATDKIDYVTKISQILKHYDQVSQIEYTTLSPSDNKLVFVSTPDIILSPEDDILGGLFPFSRELALNYFTLTILSQLTQPNNKSINKASKTKQRLLQKNNTYLNKTKPLIQDRTTRIITLINDKANNWSLLPEYFSDTFLNRYKVPIIIGLIILLAILFIIVPSLMHTNTPPSNIII
ncbi:hypothetical protein NEOKW01_1478 [Nematocida sp. AWRm80]|nr:hypothetical protein NEOKW01_1478 [Nematocida sp. AWRm80]